MAKWPWLDGLLDAIGKHLEGSTNPIRICVCGGKCPCHWMLPFGGEPCPPNCPNYGLGFDICHLCDYIGKRGQ